MLVTFIVAVAVLVVDAEFRQAFYNPIWGKKQYATPSAENSKATGDGACKNFGESRESLVPKIGIWTIITNDFNHSGFQESRTD
jgi:hypothetical protein